MSAQDIRDPVLTQQIQFVVGAEGKPTGVLLGIAVWERILQALEDIDDLALARQTLAEIEAAGGDLEKAGFVFWDEVRKDLVADDAEE
jgi:hypothetical protein